MKEQAYQAMKNSILCRNMQEQQIRKIVNGCKIQIKTYEKNEFIFLESDAPKKLYVLISGKVCIAQETFGGKRILLTNIETPGDVFGEVYLFMECNHYEMHAKAVEKSVILELSDEIFQDEWCRNCEIEGILQQNLLFIFAKKAYGMNRKLKVLQSSSIRAKIARYLIESQQKDGHLEGLLSREDMADYLNVTRPSLSRELSKMQEEGILMVNGKNLVIQQQELLEEYL